MGKLILLVTVVAALSACGGERAVDPLNESIALAATQTRSLLPTAGEPDGDNYPRTMDDEGGLVTTGMRDWTSGFFPGSLWYLYELTGEAEWKEHAERWTATLEPLKSYTGTHDIGFMVYCSYGNAERLASRPGYRDIMVETAGSLCRRFNPVTGTIKSWNGGRAWDGETVWSYPVIIDNMMNLELLFYASRVTGEAKYYDIAVKHADTTLKNHFRPDGTTYHVVDYDPATGAVRSRNTAQGFSDNSTWARGQAWAIYGYTMTYRETREKRYLDVAVKAADVFIEHLPEDLVPLWDLNAGQQGYTPGVNSGALHITEQLRDASAGAIVCSALFELAGLAGRPDYTDTATGMLHSLASPAYSAAPGENAGFILKHCVGSIPHRSEIDKPLVYADYYFLEALKRYRDINGNHSM